MLLVILLVTVGANTSVDPSSRHHGMLIIDVGPFAHALRCFGKDAVRTAPETLKAQPDAHEFLVPLTPDTTPHHTTPTVTQLPLWCQSHPTTLDPTPLSVVTAEP
jgi:hypothetical protein